MVLCEPLATFSSCQPDPCKNLESELRALLEAPQAKGTTLREMAAALAGLGITTRSGQPLSPSGVKNHLQRLGLLG